MTRDQQIATLNRLYQQVASAKIMFTQGPSFDSSWQVPHPFDFSIGDFMIRDLKADRKISCSCQPTAGPTPASPPAAPNAGPEPQLEPTGPSPSGNLESPPALSSSPADMQR